MRSTARMRRAPGRRAPRRADLKLKPAPVTSDQLTNAEWLASAPGPDELKRVLLNCTDCHSCSGFSNPSTPVHEFLQVFDRMGGYYPGASDMQPQRLVGEHRRPAVESGDGAAVRRLSRGAQSQQPRRCTASISRRTPRADRPRHPRHHHRIRSAAEGDPAARRHRRSRRRRLVLAFRRAVPVQARSEDRQGHRLSDPGAEARPSQGHARPRGRSRRRHLGRHDVSGRHGAVRPQDREVPHLSGADGMADRRHPAIALLGGRHEGRRQGLGEELRPLAGA